MSVVIEADYSTYTDEELAKMKSRTHRSLQNVMNQVDSLRAQLELAVLEEGDWRVRDNIITTEINKRKATVSA